MLYVTLSFLFGIGCLLIAIGLNTSTANKKKLASTPSLRLEHRYSLYALVLSIFFPPVKMSGSAARKAEY